MKEVESKWYDVELVRQLAREYYHQSCHNPCRINRGRAGYELLKCNQTKKKFQRQYVELCDETMSNESLYQFLQSQNLQIPL